MDRTELEQDRALERTVVENIKNSLVHDQLRRYKLLSNGFVPLKSIVTHKKVSVLRTHSNDMFD
jgi:hypothetical protein